MRALKRRPSTDAMRSQVRPKGGRLGRIVYLGILLTLILVALDAFFGHLVYFRAQGLVVADAAELGSEYTATVRSISVKRGDEVALGDPIAVLGSQEVAERIARIAADIAETQGRLAEVRADLGGKKRLENEAKRRLEETQKLRERFNEAADRKIITARERLDVTNEYYRSFSEVESLRSSIEGLSAEVNALRSRLATAEDALADLRRQFDGGTLRAPWNGLVTDVTVLEGSVVTPGEPVARIAREPHYVLAFQPTGTLYDIAVGEPLTVSDGIRNYPARITAILPLTARLPEEFRRTFRPAAQEQVLRIEFTGEPEYRPPLFATTSVSRPHWWVFRTIRAWLKSFFDISDLQFSW